MTPALGLSPADVVDPRGIGLRLLIDLVAIAILAIGLFYRRHRRLYLERRYQGVYLLTE